MQTVADLIDAMLRLENHPPPPEATKEDREDYAVRLREAAYAAHRAVYYYKCVRHRGLVFLASLPVRKTVVLRIACGGEASDLPYPPPKPPPKSPPPYPPPGVPEKVAGFLSQDHF